MTPTAGGTARRAVVRWAWRMFRREWRQQFLVLALLTVAVAAAIGFASAAYTVASGSDNGHFGAASHFMRFDATDPDALAADVAAAREAFDTHEVIYHRQVAAPGLFEPVDYRAQDPAGPLGGPRMALLEGTYPAGGQVAITDGIADVLRVRIGGSLELDGQPRTVVGLVENPGDLADEFVLVPLAQHGDADSVTILVDVSDDQAKSFRTPSAASGLEIGSRQANVDVVAAVTVLVVATVGLLLIALMAAASFVVVAHRRLRQIGMLAAIGATEKQLRLVTLANGAVVGLVAAVAGTAAGLAGWLAVASPVEDAVGYRVDRFDVPLWLVACGMLLAIVAGTAAAWWPARKVARVSPVRALSGRPPEPRPARRAAALAAMFTAVAVGCLALGGEIADETTVYWTNAVLLVAGVVALALGVLFACPVAIRVLAMCVGRLPVAARLGVGDLARYRSRSGAALAAISLVVGIAVATVASATAAQAAAGQGNLPENHVLIRAHDGPFIPQTSELDRLEAAAGRIAASLDQPRVTALDVALDPDAKPSSDGLQAVSLAERAGDMWRDVSLLYLPTPQLLSYYGYGLDSVRPGTKFLSREIGDLGIVGDVAPPGSTGRPKIDTFVDVERLGPGYGSLPGTFVVPDVLRERGWVAAPAGRWLVQTASPPTAEQLATAREIAAGAGLTVEVRDRQGGLGALRSGATAVGLLVALGVLAMTIGLVRGEAGRDLRVLAATGARKATRRTLTAATAGGLALLGAVLGTAGAYLGFTAGFLDDLGRLTPIPVLHLAVITIGLPMIAIFAAWLLSGREPADVARQPME